MIMIAPSLLPARRRGFRGRGREGREIKDRAAKKELRSLAWTFPLGLFRSGVLDVRDSKKSDDTL